MKKMLKAFSGIALACLLIVGVCATVFAAPSTGIWNASVEGAAAVELPQDASLQQLPATVVGYWDIEAGQGTTLTFTYNAMPQGATLTVYHFYDGSWHQEAGQQTGNKITVTVAHGSPFALVCSQGSAPVDPGKKSDKTGEVDYLLFAALAAVLVGGVVAGVAIRKNRA